MCRWHSIAVAHRPSSSAQHGSPRSLGCEYLHSQADARLSLTNLLIDSSTCWTYSLTSIKWERVPDLSRIAGLCELYFEWGLKEIILKHFRTVLWPSAVLRILLRSVITADKLSERMSRRRPPTPAEHFTDEPLWNGTSPRILVEHPLFLELQSLDLAPPTRVEEPLVVKIHSSREHASTDGILEYRLEIAPAQLVRLAEAGIRGLRTVVLANLTHDSAEEAEEVGDDRRGFQIKGKDKATKGDPLSHLRIWVPACIVHMTHPDLVAEFEAIQTTRQSKKASSSFRPSISPSSIKTSRDAEVAERGTTSLTATPSDVRNRPDVFIC